MAKKEGKLITEGYQPGDRLGHKPPKIEKRGYQPRDTGKPVAQNPPKIDSSAEPPKGSADKE